MIRATAVAAAIAILASAAGCATATPSVLPDQLPAGQVFLYRHAESRITAFDVAENQAHSISMPEQTYQYRFANDTSLFSSGDSEGRQFEIIEITASSARTVVRAPSGTGVFPLASDGRRALFYQVPYSRVGAPLPGTIVELRGDALDVIADGPGLVVAGALIGSDLFMSVAADDGETYDIWQLDISRANADPTLVTTDVRSPKIFAHEGQVVIDMIRGDSQHSYPCEYACLVTSRPEVAFLRPTVDGDLEAGIWESGSERVLSAGSIIDVAWEEDALVVYLDGRVDRHPRS